MLVAARGAGARVVNVSSELGSLHYLSAQYGNRVAGADSIEELLGIGFDPDDRQQAGGAVPTYRLTKACHASCLPASCRFPVQRHLHRALLN